MKAGHADSVCVRAGEHDAMSPGSRRFGTLHTLVAVLAAAGLVILAISVWGASPA
jgi:hypothetical protein